MTAQRALSAESSRSGGWGAVWTLALVWAMAMLDRMVLLMLIPGIKTTMGLTDTEVSLLYGLAFAVCFSVIGIPLGHLVDRWNRRNMLAVGLIGWSLATVVCGFAHDFWTFFAARMAVGAFQAMLAPAAISMVADMFPAAQRGRPTALLLASAIFGGALANFFGGGLFEYFQHNPAPALPAIGQLAAWQLAMIGAGLLSLTALPLLLLVVREPHRETAAASDGPRFALGAYMARHAAMFVALFGAFVVIAVASQGVGNWWPMVFMRQGGLSAAEAGGLLGTVSLLGGAVSAVVGGLLSDWAARRDPHAGRLKLIAVSMIGLCLSLLPLFNPEFVPGVTAALAVTVVLMGIVAATCFSLLPDLVPPQGRGLLIAIYQLVTNLIGFGFGPTAVALVTNQVLSDENRVADAMLLFGMPLMALAGVLALTSVPFVRRMRAAQMAA